ncbi:hypothetical protein BC351_01110 [Paenibacillus ferrarius]|uniref:Uncharacterized protein n=1 Tax=Paenibacillus ferrarius TaxID=1469647 RepID=A0A1V4HSH4_9BACL|nr:hypothetical protein [Paenibacillus ferrarius]OPH61870.1 hypothetical protein BC351_01110 [Paenibacillus ferrarius]
MVNNNDNKILELKKQIEEKRAKVDKSKKFTPITNCSIELDGIRHNIQVLGKEQIIQMMINLNTYILSAKDLGLLDEYVITGYNAVDWMTDLRAKLEFLNRKDEENKLKAMEAKLDKLLSNDKKIELEIGEIESLLKE